ncbi:peptidoglycan DD-metalloendopeptidase family protein, partial [bacterium]|nr:peptidoglycan DD-metalloendopeptidase family protein [bacterium]
FSSSNIDKHQTQLKKIEGEISKNKNLIKLAQKKENIALHDIDNIDQKLAVSHKKISDLKRNLRKTNGNINYLENRITGLEKKFKNIKEDTRNAVKNWYILNVLFNNNKNSTGGDIKDILKYEILQKLNEKNYDYIQNVISKKADYSDKILNYRKEYNKLKKMQALLELELQNIRSEKQLKEIYLSKIKKKKSSYKSYLLGLEKKKKRIQRDIQKLLNQVSAHRKKTVLTKGVISIYRHIIQRPVPGSITSKFGKFWNKEYEITINNDGIEIDSGSESIFAPCLGTVIFADWLKGKGNVIIISYDQHLSLIYGNLDDIFVKKGDKLEKKQLIGKIGKDMNNKRILYFGTWLDSKPVNPEYIIKR